MITRPASEPRVSKVMRPGEDISLDGVLPVPWFAFICTPHALITVLRGVIHAFIRKIQSPIGHTYHLQFALHIRLQAIRSDSMRFR